MVKSCDSSKISPVATEAALREGPSAEMALPLCCRRWLKNRVNTPGTSWWLWKNPVESLDTGLLDCSVSFCVCKQRGAGTYAHTGTYSECCPRRRKAAGGAEWKRLFRRGYFRRGLAGETPRRFKKSTRLTAASGHLFPKSTGPRVLSSLASS